MATARGDGDSAGARASGLRGPAPAGYTSSSASPSYFRAPRRSSTSLSSFTMQSATPLFSREGVEVLHAADVAGAVVAVGDGLHGVHIRHWPRR